ncbi:AAA family ATPase [Streptomyces sp. NPDC090493]|uniref:AAA family ATPase n=1 Tax=Streptomyces sp. NPDC090493 TaxID=3365964 RepID=UPI0037F4A70C
MIVWINGGFGAGKSTLAAALAEQVDGAVVADPEDIGSAVRNALRGHRCEQPDYQDYLPWEATVVSFIAGLYAYTGGPVIVPMSVLVQDRALRMLAALDDCADVHHLVVHAEPAVLSERIASARAPGEDPQRAARIRAYRLRRLDDYRHAAKTWLPASGHVIDTSMLTREQTLTAALDHLRQGEPAVCADLVCGRELR